MLRSLLVQKSNYFRNHNLSRRAGLPVVPKRLFAFRYFTNPAEENWINKHLRVLELPESTPHEWETIKTQYYKLVRKHHPDSNPLSSPQEQKLSQLKTSQINESFTQLSEIRAIFQAAKEVE